MSPTSQSRWAPRSAAIPLCGGPAARAKSIRRSLAACIAVADMRRRFGVEPDAMSVTCSMGRRRTLVCASGRDPAEDSGARAVGVQQWCLSRRGRQHRRPLGHGSRASSSARRMAAGRPPWWSMNHGLPPPHIRRLASGASLSLDQHGARPGPPVGQNGLMRSGGIATTAIDDRTMMWRTPN